MARLFGTDGVRGIANSELTCELTFKIGQAGAYVLTNEVHAPRIIIGRDTRISGEMLSSALVAGICSVGAEAVDAGIIPTPGLAYLVKQYNADAAVMISASHNSFEYNGLKWFNRHGYKLSDALEDAIEAIVTDSDAGLPLAEGSRIGCPVKAQNARLDYLERLLDVSENDLSGVNIVLDCANGAASGIAPELFARLGATVHTLFNTPDGLNINAQCGSTHPHRLQQAVMEKGADIGIAFDGDADRMIAVDEYGVVVNGDSIMAICAQDMKERGVLKSNTIVATVMSNLGMKLCMRDVGIDIAVTDVGDRYVLEKMRECDYSLGGEQSGHFIFLDKSTTGDGMLSALELLSVMKRKGESLTTLARQIEIFPQVLVNVRIKNEHKADCMKNKAMKTAIEKAEKKMGDAGRVLVRASGTEPLIRIMLEGRDQTSIQGEAIRIAHVLEEEFEGKIIQ